jgi:hypothetical protein
MQCIALPGPKFVAILAAVFVATGMVFFVHNQYVSRRQNKVMTTARTNAIVSSLFPSNVRDRILKEEEQVEREMNTNSFVHAKHRLKSFSKTSQKTIAKVLMSSTKPIADLFQKRLSCLRTWWLYSLEFRREPFAFYRYETVYHAFDQIAKRRGLRRDRGDCYVAVAGLLSL